MALFSHNIQRIALVAFLIGIILSIIYLLLTAHGVEITESVKSSFIVLDGGIICIAALIAPFTKEKNETDVVKHVRLLTISTISIVAFCLIIIAFFIQIIFEQFPLDEVVSLRSVLLFEIVYFIVLKIKVSKLS